jgi:hypothetical protein
MYENTSQPLASLKIFYRRLRTNFFYACLFIGICLGIGILGYHYTANIPWLDSFHNASMILSGMGPVVEIKTDIGKWFSSIYAIFSGVAFISGISILMAPAVHRFFHKLHLQQDDDEKN